MPPTPVEPDEDGLATFGPVRFVSPAGRAFGSVSVEVVSVGGELPPDTTPDWVSFTTETGTVPEGAYTDVFVVVDTAASYPEAGEAAMTFRVRATEAGSGQVASCAFPVSHGGDVQLVIVPHEGNVAAATDAPPVSRILPPYAGDNFEQGWGDPPVYYQPLAGHMPFVVPSADPAWTFPAWGPWVGEPDPARDPNAEPYEDTWLITNLGGTGFPRAYGKAGGAYADIAHWPPVRMSLSFYVAEQDYRTRIAGMPSAFFCIRYADNLNFVGVAAMEDNSGNPGTVELWSVAGGAGTLLRSWPGNTVAWNCWRYDGPWLFIRMWYQYPAPSISEWVNVPDLVGNTRLGFACPLGVPDRNGQQASTRVLYDLNAWEWHDPADDTPT